MNAFDRWKDKLPARDLKVFEASGYGQEVGFGDRPVLIIIDVNYNFLGDRSEPILESIKHFPYSCGEAGWTALPHLERLVDAAREAGVTVAYSTGRWSPAGYDTGVLGTLNKRHRELTGEDFDGYRILPQIAPRPGDMLVEKHYPSMFFGTPLMSFLNHLSIDTVLITGCTTSGCVRATTVDAYSYNFKTVVVRDCVFDRSESSHLASLVDMDMKYADVVDIDAAVAYLGSLTKRSSVPLSSTR